MAPDAEKERQYEVSVPSELAAEISKRLNADGYSSVSELFVEAFRLLLRVESGGAHESARLDAALSMQVLGHSGERPPEGISEAEFRSRLKALDRREQLHDGVRLAPERVERILRGSESTED